MRLQIGEGLVDLQIHNKEAIAVATLLNQEVVFKLKAMSLRRNFTLNRRPAKVSGGFWICFLARYVCIDFNHLFCLWNIGCADHISVILKE